MCIIKTPKDSPMSVGRCYNCKFGRQTQEVPFGLRIRCMVQGCHLITWKCLKEDGIKEI